MNVTFHEDWFSETSQFVITKLASLVEHLEGRYVEIGAWEGRSTLTIANRIYPTFLDTVDTWEGSPGEESEPLAAERDVYKQFLANVAYGTKGNVDHHKMGWREYVRKDRTPVRFLFIDAEHSYQEVADNIHAFLPLMVDGGIVCGDDFMWEQVRRAATAVLGHLHVASNLWWVRI